MFENTKSVAAILHHTNKIQTANIVAFFCTLKMSKYASYKCAQCSLGFIILFILFLKELFKLRKLFTNKLSITVS